MLQIAEQISNLRSSPLYGFRNTNGYKSVIGEGSLSASVIFIGEAPGQKEAETGRPFQGRAGKKLDEMLSSVGIERDDVYITNIVKDRPPENRNPSRREINLYAPYLDRQIEIIKPKVIATLGQFSTDYILNRYVSSSRGRISDIHGETFVAKMSYDEVLIMPLFHPAYALYNPQKSEELLADFKKLKKIIKD